MLVRWKNVPILSKMHKWTYPQVSRLSITLCIKHVLLNGWISIQVSWLSLDVRTWRRAMRSAQNMSVCAMTIDSKSRSPHWRIGLFLLCQFTPFANLVFILLTDRRKKLGNRKTSPAPDVYYNSAVTGMSPTGNMDDMTSVSQVPSIPPPPGQQAHQQQQKITRQHVPQIPAPAAHQHAPVPGQQHVTTQAHQQHSQQILLPPPPTLQHRTTVQHQQQVICQIYFFLQDSWDVF